MSPARLKAQSYHEAHDQFFVAKAIAEAAMGEVFELASRIALWKDGDRQLLDDLKKKERRADLRYQQARVRLLYTFTEHIDAVLNP